MRRPATCLLALLSASYVTGLLTCVFLLYVVLPVWFRWRPGRGVACWLLDTPLASVAAWLRFGCLYVPEWAVLACAAGVFGALFPRQWMRFYVVFGVAWYCTTHALGASPVDYATQAFFRASWSQVIGMSVLGALLYLTPLLLGLAVARTIRAHHSAPSGFLVGWDPLSWRAVRRNKVLLWRFVAVAFLLSLYSRAEWVALRTAYRDATVLVLRVIGIPTAISEQDRPPTLDVAGESHDIQAGCTYLMLLLMLAPLVWAPKEALWTNMCRIGALAAAVAFLNVARLASTVLLHAAGWSWAWTEHFPNCILFVGPIVVAFAFRLSETDGPRAAGHGVERQGV